MVQFSHLDANLHDISGEAATERAREAATEAARKALAAKEQLETELSRLKEKQATQREEHLVKQKKLQDKKRKDCGKMQ